MAFMQPENIASRNDVPQRLQTVASFLRDLVPHDVTVWLERTGDGESAALRREFENAPRSDDDGDCYLVVFDPSCGIAVIESPTLRQVRSWGRRRTALNQDLVRTEIAQRVTSLRDEAQRLSLEVLPVRHVLGLPNVPRVHALKLETRLPLLSEEDFAQGKLSDALRDAIGGAVLPLASPSSTDHRIGGSDAQLHSAAASHRRPLDTAEVAAARAVVNPDVVIRARPHKLFKPVDPSGEDVIRTLDREQERLARNLGTGYRQIRGVAGSGKTLVLTYRARHIGELFPEWRILLLCFNRPLASALRAEMRDVINVTVSTVDRLAYRLLKDADRLEEKTASPDFEARRQIAAETVAGLPPSARYDLVLVDEAQDLGSEGLDLAWAMLKPERDHFVVALDGAQRIYRGKRRWNPPNTTAQGRTKVLKHNYRNTREILDAALMQLGDAVRRVRDDEESDEFDVLVLPERAVRRGKLPTVLVCDSLRSEVTTVVEAVAALRAQGVPPDDIAVLSGWRDLRQDAIRRIPDSFDVQAHRDEAASAEGVVRVATLQLLKGLEYRHVIIGGANHIWVDDDDAAEQDRQRRRLLYVAMTRASETLTVTYSGNGIMSAMDAFPQLN